MGRKLLKLPIVELTNFMLLFAKRSLFYEIANKNNVNFGIIVDDY